MKKVKKAILLFLIFVLIILAIWATKIIVIHELRKDDLPILGYHSVVSDVEKETNYKNDVYVMSASQFEEQMKYIFEQKYETLGMDDINEYYTGKRELGKKSVALTFDDGYKNFNTVVKPILKKYKLKATCFVIGEKVEKATTNKNIAKKYLQLDDLKNDKNVSYYSHSYALHHKASGFDRKQIQTMSDSEIDQDFKSNRNFVDGAYFAFPYGRTVENAPSILEDNDVILAFGYNQNRNMNRNDNKYLLPRYLMFAKMPFFYFKWIIE